MIPELSAAPTRPASGRTFISLLVATLATALLALTSFALLRAGVFFSFYTSLLGKVIETTGLDLWASRAVTLGVLAVLWFLPRHLLLLPWIKNAKRQVVTIILCAALAMAAMELVTRDVYFSRADGRPLKYYVQTLDDGGYKFAASSGTDPLYGIPYQPITADVARQYLLWRKRGGQMQDQSVPPSQNFNPANGEPLRWYAKLPDGRIDMFTLPGFHPTYGTKLLPATPEAVAAYEKQKAEIDRQRQAEADRKRLKAEQEAERQARAEVKRKAKEERDRQARAEARLKEPLQPGRYVPDPRPQGRVGELSFTLAEINLTADRLLVHLEIEDKEEMSVTCCYPHSVRFGVLTADGLRLGVLAIRHTTGATPAADGSFEFGRVRPRTAVVLECARPEPVDRTLSVLINDQPLFSGVNLHRAEFRSF